MGLPRKSWLSLRAALNSSLIIGLHRRNGVADDDPRVSLWPMIWQTDRQLSCILGMPAALPDWHPGLSRDFIGPSPMEQLLYELVHVQGAIIQRDQNPNNSSYAATVQMDQDWERCKGIMPAEFWEHESPPNAPFAVLYHRHMAKLHYWITGQLIHLPYMHNAGKYEISRIACLEASREVIKGYRAFRDNTAHVVVCELMDFKCFSAAMVLAVDMLCQPGRPPHDQAVAAEDWNLIETVARDMKNTSAAIDCMVASQGAHTLELLLMIHNGNDTGPERYDAVIPYFGRVRISCEQMKGPPEPAAGEYQGVGGLGTMSPTLQFSAATNFNLDIPFDFCSDLELQCDWTMDMDMQSFDWVESFRSS